MQERRKGTRLSLESHLVMQRVDEKDDEDVLISIIDLSKSGVGFACDKLLQVGSIYESYLQIWTKETIHAFLEITRIKETGDSYEYGAFFVGMPESESSRIEVYNVVTKTSKEMEETKGG